MTDSGKHPTQSVAPGAEPEEHGPLPDPDLVRPAEAAWDESATDDEQQDFDTSDPPGTVG